MKMKANLFIFSFLIVLLLTLMFHEHYVRNSDLSYAKKRRKNVEEKEKHE